MNSAAASMSSTPAIVTGLNNPTSSIANDLNTSDIVNHASGELGVSLDKINIFLQSYIDIVILDAQTDSTNISTLTVDITPMTKTIATTATKINDIVTDDNINKNAVQFGDSQTLNITTPVTITLPVPTNLSTTNLLVKHRKSNGDIFYYNADASVNGFVTFTVTNGFSEFTLLADNRKVGVNFEYNNKPSQYQTYTAVNIANTFPVDTKDGYIF